MEGHRVKVYRLNEDGTWDDGGTGYVRLERQEEVRQFASSDCLFQERAHLYAECRVMVQ